MTNDIYFHDTTAYGGLKPTIIVYVNKIPLCTLELEIDAGWVFYPTIDRTRTGFWSQRVVCAIAEKMRELNTKLFGEDPDSPKSEIVKPAIRKLDLDE